MEENADLLLPGLWGSPTASPLLGDVGSSCDFGAAALLIKFFGGDMYENKHRDAPVLLPAHFCTEYGAQHCTE